ncbi:hypothetical protein [Pleomorphomonas oryzae]|uniref:hypothetical protein n=1 Tax=Pleomorphomonas oryzae TaxID=261934 RepID=UPI00041E6132|nr:hypothetical protein [Pleomorphomonas oryzae]
MLWSFSVWRSLGLVGRTWPFLVLRLAVNLAIAVGAMLTVSIGAFLGWGLGHIVSSVPVEAGTIYGGLLGFVVLGIILWWIRDYLLYLLTAGHVAALTQAFDGTPLPPGKGQVAAALAIVRERFGEVSLLFVLDQLVKGAVRAVTRLIDWLTDLMGMPGLSGFVRLVDTVVRLSTNFIDELVLTRQIRIASTDPWTTARESIVLYAQNAPAILRNSVWLMLFRWALTVVLFALLISPAAAFVYLVPGETAGWTLAFALLLAVALQRALIDPFCIAALMQVYFAEIEGQRPNPDWDDRLAEASRPFRDLINRGREGFAA